MNSFILKSLFDLVFVSEELGFIESKTAKGKKDESDEWSRC